MKTKMTISTALLETAAGPMIMGSTADGIVLLEFVDRTNFQGQLASLRKTFQAEIVESAAPPYFEELSSQLSQYFSGQRKDFDLPLVFAGTEFQQKVWKTLLKVPYGQTRSYKDQAISYGNLKAIRAVARANGQNRIAIVVPCHRIVGSDGSLTGYAGGVERKQQLLSLESAHA